MPSQQIPHAAVQQNIPKNAPQPYTGHAPEQLAHKAACKAQLGRAGPSGTCSPVRREINDGGQGAQGKNHRYAAGQGAFLFQFTPAGQQRNQHRAASAAGTDRPQAPPPCR